MAENRHFPLTIGIALTTVYALTCYTVKITKITKNRILSHPLVGGLEGNVRIPSVARWKARRRLYIRHMERFYRASICEDGLGSLNSVRLSVCHTRGL